MYKTAPLRNGPARTLMPVPLFKPKMLRLLKRFGNGFGGVATFQAGGIIVTHVVSWGRSNQPVDCQKEKEGYCVIRSHVSVFLIHNDTEKVSPAGLV